MYQHPVLVGQAHRQTIDLQFADQVEIRVIQQPFYPPVPGLQVFLVEGVAQTEHGQPVLNLLKAVRRICADPLGRRLCSYQTGMLFLQPSKLHHQSVVLAVVDFSVVQHVVTIVVMIYLFTQLRHPPSNVVVHHDRWFSH